MAKKTYVEKLNIKLTRSNLDRVIIALVTNPHNKKFAKTTDLLLGSMNHEIYNGDMDRTVRIALIEKLVHAIYYNNLTDTDSLMSLVDLDGKYDEQMITTLKELSEYELNEAELKAVDKMVANQLKYGTLKNSARKIIDLMASVESDFYDDFNTILRNAEMEIGDVYKQLKAASESIVLNKNDLKLDDESLLATTDAYLEEKRSDEYRLKTGIQALNQMLSGGFQKGRLYCAYAPKKSGKSLMLLNACLWVKRWNEFDVSDGKRPVIVLLSMENTTYQQRDRLWKWVNGNSSDVAKVSTQQYIQSLKEGGIQPKSELEARIDLLYRPNRTIDTDDLKGIIDDYDANGERVVFFALDYIGRIKSSDKNAVGVDEIMEASFVSNELVNIARETNIPILTAQQMNRMAMDGFDKAGDDFNKKMEAASKGTSSNVQGSFRLTQNVDFGFTLNFLERREQLPEGDILNGKLPKKEQFFFMKLTECRDESPDVTQFFHPMAKNNGVRYLEDIKSKKSASFQKIDLENKLLVETYTGAQPSIVGGEPEIIRFEG